jgi:hypothetical protein
MSCDDTLTFFDYANWQLTGSALFPDDDNNARTSLNSLNPFTSADLRQNYAARVLPGLAYFILAADGCPILVVPPSSPSYPQYEIWRTGQGTAAPPIPSPPPPPTDTFYAAGAAAIGAAHLGAADTENAFNSLNAQDPFLSAAERAASLALVKAGLAYFTLTAAGDPQLVIPTAAPPQPGPCPPGFVSQPPAFTSQYTLEEMINHQFLQIPAAQDLSTGPCKPLSTVTTVGQWVTADDCLAVTVLKTLATTGLTLSTRTLTCDGVLQYGSYNLDAVPVNVRATVTIPPTPGYLLDAAVSNVGSGIAAGSVFASISIQHTCAAGVAPGSMLAAGYVTDLYAVSWPAQPGGAPYSPPTALPGPAVPTIMQYGSALTATDTSPVTVTLTKTVTAGSALVAFCGEQGAYSDNAVSDDQGNGWVRIYRNLYQDLWIAPNCKPGPTKVSSQHPGGSGLPQMLHVVEIARIAAASPVDVTAHNANGGPITATTSSTTFADVAVAIVTGLATVTAGVTAPAGWVQILDTTDVGGNRMVSLANLNLSTPPATWAFTSTMKASDTYVTLAALKVATA